MLHFIRGSESIFCQKYAKIVEIFNLQCSYFQTYVIFKPYKNITYETYQMGSENKTSTADYNRYEIKQEKKHESDSSSNKTRKSKATNQET